MCGLFTTVSSALSSLSSTSRHYPAGGSCRRRLHSEIRCLFLEYNLQLLCLNTDVAVCYRIVPATLSVAQLTFLGSKTTLYKDGGVLRFDPDLNRSFFPKQK